MFRKEKFFDRKKKELGVSLNEVQKKAVLHTEGPLLLLASPGSGKTTTTIMRIGYLIEEKGVHPTRIKAVTFSKAAANDMRQRFQRFFPEYTDQSVDFSTIHSLAFEVVREYFYKNRVSYQIIEGNKEAPIQKTALIKQLFNRFTNEIMSEDQLEELTTFISFIKNKMVPRKDWETVNCGVPSALQIFQEYENYKKSAMGKLLLDFDDMLTIANDVFHKDASLLRKYQQRYDYVLTDESQDTSMVQHSIIEKLVKPHRNLYVVADDDQSIYTWRAAEPQYLLDFKQVYPDAAILMMEQNYRSSKEIVDTANQFIKQNKHRYIKNMFTENPSHQPIMIANLDDFAQQASYLVGKIAGLDHYKDAAVLFRNNSSSILLVNEFERAGIPFYIKDHDNRFFSHWVVKDILNFMRLSYSDKRVDIFEQIYKKLPIFITKEKMAELKQYPHNVSVFDHLLKIMDPKRAEQITECRLAFVMMKGKRPFEVMKIIRGVLGYEKTLEKIAKNLKFNKDYLLGILHTLEQIAEPLKTMEEFAARLEHLRKVIHSSKFKKNDNVVTLSTFHSSKGLEFKNVYMIDLIQGVIPTDDDLEDTDLLEEAVRLFYVGMTRAKSNLELITYKKQFGKSVRPSQFVLDVKKIITPSVKIHRREPLKRNQAGNPIIPANPHAVKSPEALKEDITVKHRVFGTGTIVQLDQEHIEIQFQRGIKKLSIKTCLEMGLLEIV
ncbi:ATP-dependent helicase [Neobacillus dielmonensis]|uniref:ATP-dependent helicase n=1 Tax=Neobacillus dielmonensis TaxID=1347369 RepID=UPI0005AA2B4F|nr:ATP-dependent helicase [Neobacillus dielmonensis]